MSFINYNLFTYINNLKNQTIVLLIKLFLNFKKFLIFNKYTKIITLLMNIGHNELETNAYYIIIFIFKIVFSDGTIFCDGAIFKSRLIYILYKLL